MLRILILALLGLAVWLLIKRALRNKARPQEPDRRSEPMLACSLCGLHVPESEGTMRDGAFYCCEAHSRRSDERDRR